MAEIIEATLELDLAAALKEVEDFGAGLALLIENAGTAGSTALAADLAAVDFTGIQSALEAAVAGAAPAIVGDITEAVNGVTVDPVEVPVEVDSAQAEEAFAEVGGTATTAAQDFSGFTNAASQLQGSLGTLPGPIGQVGSALAGINPVAAAAVAGLSLLATAGYSYVKSGIEAQAAAQRSIAVFGDAADAIDRITVAGRTQTLEQFAASLGSADEKAQNAITSFGRLAVAAGATRAEAAQLGAELVKVAAKGIESGKFTDLGEAITALSNGFVRGGRALRDFGINLSAAEITEDAIARTGKAANQLTLYDRTVSGAALAQRQFGDSLDESIRLTTQNAEVLDRAAQQANEIAKEKAGAPLVKTFLEAKKALDEFLASITRLAGSLLVVVSPAFSGLAILLGGVADALSFVTELVGTIAGAFGPVVPILVGGFLAVNGAIALVGLAINALVGIATVSLSTVLLPLGLLAAGIGILSSVFGDSSDEADKNAEANTRAKTAIEALNKTARDSAEGLITESEAAKASSEALKESVDAIFEAGQGKNVAEAEQFYAKFGVTAEIVTKALSGNEEALNTVNVALGKSSATSFSAAVGAASFSEALETQTEALRGQQIAAITTAKIDGEITAGQAKRLLASDNLKKGTLDLVAATTELGTAEAKRVDDLKRIAAAHVDTTKAVTELVTAVQQGKADDTFIAEFAVSIGQDEAKVKAAVDDLQASFNALSDGFASSLPTVDDAFTAGKDAISAQLDAYIATFDDAGAEAKAGAEARAQVFRDALTGWIDPQATIDALKKQTDAIASFVPNIQALLDQGLTALAQEAAVRGPAFAAEFASGAVPDSLKTELNAQLEKNTFTREEAQAKFAAILPALSADGIASVATTLGLPLSEAFSQAVTSGVDGAEAAAEANGVKLPEGVAAGAKAGEAAAKAAVENTVKNIVAVQDAIGFGFDALALVIEADTSLGAAFEDNAATSVDRFATALAAWFPTAINLFSSLGAALSPVARGQGAQVGAAFADGFASGLAGHSSVIADAARKAAKAAERAAKDALGVRSPSRVAMEIGEQFGTGLAMGIEGQTRQVSAAAAALVSVGSPGSKLPSPVTLPTLRHTVTADPALLHAVRNLDATIGRMEAGSRTVTVDARTTDARRIASRVVEAIR